MDKNKLIEKQDKIKQQITIPKTFDLSKIKKICGLDVSFDKNDNTNNYVSAVIMEYPSMKLLYSLSGKVTLPIQYVAGFLGFRESDIFCNILDDIKSKNPSMYPDLLMVDGNGLWHPSRCGSACHVGVKSKIPTIGIAKNPYLIEDLTHDKIKKISKTLDHRQNYKMKGNSDEKIFGAIVKNKSNVKPIFVSVGSGIDLDSAIEIVNNCSFYRIPEPIRHADILSRTYVKNNNM
jgi:endonuclease V